jgi:hypothetical protein
MYASPNLRLEQELNSKRGMAENPNPFIVEIRCDGLLLPPHPPIEELDGTKRESTHEGWEAWMKSMGTGDKAGFKQAAVNP